MVILAGDIGGTKSSLGLFERSATGELRKLDEKTVPTDSYPSPEDMMVAFVDNRAAQREGRYRRIRHRGAGDQRRVPGRELPWKREVRDTSLAQALNVRRVSLLNDLSATANGVRFLKDEQIVTAATTASPSSTATSS